MCIRSHGPATSQIQRTQCITTRQISPPRNIRRLKNVGIFREYFAVVEEATQNSQAAAEWLIELARLFTGCDKEKDAREKECSPPANSAKMDSQPEGES